MRNSKSRASSPNTLRQKHETRGGTVNSYTASNSPNDQGRVLDTNEVAHVNQLTKWWSDEEEHSVRRKLDSRVVLISFLLYLVALLDRSNIGNAKTAGMEKDLNMSDFQYQWLLTIFYIAYIVFQFQV